MDLAAVKSSIAAWERTFAISHGGRKPDRGDVCRAGSTVLGLYQQYAALLGGNELQRLALEKRAGVDGTHSGLGAPRKAPPLTTSHLAANVPLISRARRTLKCALKKNLDSKASMENMPPAGQFGPGPDMVGTPAPTNATNHELSDSESEQSADRKREELTARQHAVPLKKRRRPLVARPRDAMPGFRKRGAAACIAKRASRSKLRR